MLMPVLIPMSIPMLIPAHMSMQCLGAYAYLPTCPCTCLLPTDMFMPTQTFFPMTIHVCMRISVLLSLSISIPMSLPAHVLILLLVTCDAHAYKETVLNALAAIQNMSTSQCFVIAPPLAITALMRAAIDGMSFSAPG